MLILISRQDSLFQKFLWKFCTLCTE